MKLILVDPHLGLCDAFKKAFDGLPNVEIIKGYFQDVPAYDCMVSAANAFGLMDGGIDAAIVNYFGPSLMARVQDRILDEYLGEQPIGTSMIVETGHPKHPFIAHTPTMRVPMNIALTDNVYTAMWAMFLAVHRHNQTAERKIEIIACPGLGTGTGHVPYNHAALEMALAYKNYLNPPKRIDWLYAEDRNMAVWHINPPRE